MKKITLAGAFIIGTVLFTAGCSAQPDGPAEPELPKVENVSIDFTTQEIPVGEIVEINGENLPAITNLTGTSFDFYHGGSSSCPNVIDAITAEGNDIVIKFEEPGNKACTADFIIKADTVEFVDHKITDQNVFYLEAFDGTRVEISDLMESLSI